MDDCETATTRIRGMGMSQSEQEQLAVARQETANCTCMSVASGVTQPAAAAEIRHAMSGRNLMLGTGCAATA